MQSRKRIEEKKYTPRSGARHTGPKEMHESEQHASTKQGGEANTHSGPTQYEFECINNTLLDNKDAEGALRTMRDIEQGVFCHPWNEFHPLYRRRFTEARVCSKASDHTYETLTVWRDGELESRKGDGFVEYILTMKEQEHILRVTSLNAEEGLVVEETEPRMSAEEELATIEELLLYQFKEPCDVQTGFGDLQQQRMGHSTRDWAPQSLEISIGLDRTPGREYKLFCSYGKAQLFKSINPDCLAEYVLAFNSNRDCVYRIHDTSNIQIIE